MSGHSLILILGDQLSLNLSSLKAGDKTRDRILMAELGDETSYVRHHKKKMAFLFSAMRHFAQELREHGWHVDYIILDSEENKGSFAAQLAHHIADLKPKRVIATEPGEWRVREMLLGAGVTLLPDDRFICSVDEFAAWAEGRKQLRMEYFYREMRRKTGLLMKGDQPEGGQWNFDSENRKPAKADLFMPQLPGFPPDAVTSDVLDLVARRFESHFGSLLPFTFAVTRADALKALDHFIAHALPAFGDYQDAMLSGEPYLYHSILSHYLNCGLLDPIELCQAAQTAYHSGKVPLNAAEGYIRQIIGWREYVRGIYWLKMPEYAGSNFLKAHRPLPAFYWTAETDMACIRATVTQTRDLAYAHHIQRLMVTGNFALIAGLDPHELHEWYLSVYADAYEWVELPNTIGMSQFADGGVLASKPYAASGAYINRMSNYCGSCAYDVKLRTGEKACPMNALYWDFIARHANAFRKNPRMAQMIRTYEKFAPEEKNKIRSSAASFLDRL